MAALPEERIATLRAYHEAGIWTWGSLEPMLSVEHTITVIRATRDLIDHYKIGSANYLIKLIGRIDLRDATLRVADELEAHQGTHYFKRDLQMHLPPGYYNPMRIQQHH